MKGLIIDTSSSCSLLGLTEGGNLIEVKTIDSSKQLTEKLFPLLATLCDLKEIGYIAVGTGPGSFIGLRTAVTTGSCLAFALEIPLLSFPSPLIYLKDTPLGHFTLIGDAKMGKIYQMQLAITRNKISILTPPTLTDCIPEQHTLIDLCALSDLCPDLCLVGQYAYQLFTDTTTPLETAASPIYLHAL